MTDIQILEELGKLPQETTFKMPSGTTRTIDEMIQMVKAFKPGREVILKAVTGDRLLHKVLRIQYNDKTKEAKFILQEEPTYAKD